MNVARDPWLSETLARGVYRVTLANGEVPAASALRCLQPGAGEAAAMFYSKLPTEHVKGLAALTTAGFEVIEVAVTLEVDRGVEPPGMPAGIAVRPAVPEHHAGVLAIAESAFRYTRFHLDPHLPLALAHRVKRAWMESYVTGRRGSELLVATIGDQVAGFLAVLDAINDGRRTRVIDLLGVARAFQRRGVGTAMTHYFVREYRDQYDALQVGTQAANVPSLQMYGKCGFIVASTTYVAHLHVPCA